MASEKKDDWVHYSVAAGASFAYSLALPSFANVDKILLIFLLIYSGLV